MIGFSAARFWRAFLSKVTRHLIPKWGGYAIAQIDLPAVMNWLDALAATKLSGQTQRHLMNLLSRFISWAIARGLVRPFFQFGV